MGILSKEERRKALDIQIEEDKIELSKYTKLKKLAKKLIIIIPIVYGIGVLAPYFLTGYDLHGLALMSVLFSGSEILFGVYYCGSKKEISYYNMKLAREQEEKEELEKELSKEKELEKTPEYRIEKTKSAVENFKKIINQDFEDILGISYDEYQKLSPEEQQQLIKDFHAKKDNPPIINDMKEGKISLVGSGEESLLVRQGTADDLVKSEPKKLVRKKRRNNNQD